MSNFPAFSPVPTESLEAANEEIRRLKEHVAILRGTVAFVIPLLHDEYPSVAARMNETLEKTMNKPKP
jgi:hypothetical protein